MDRLARDVSLVSLALRVLPALLLVGLGFALAYGSISVRGMRSYALGVGSTVQYHDGTDITVDPELPISLLSAVGETARSRNPTTATTR